MSDVKIAYNGQGKFRDNWDGRFGKPRMEVWEDSDLKGEIYFLNKESLFLKESGAEWYSAIGK
jgi:hypothetical protein